MAKSLPHKSELPPAECEMGYTQAQVEQIIRDAGRSMYDFNQWMSGQTCAVCDGRLYNHDTKSYYACCKGVAHGLVTYGHDLQRFLDRRPIVDW